jgi:Na+/H+-dicarboxylate symporter
MESSRKKTMSLSLWIAAAMVAGILAGIAMWGSMGAKAAAAFTTAWLKPFGTIFINLLKFVVVPMVLLSIIDGVVQLGDVKKVGTIGIRTLIYFLVTTAIACVIGLALGTAFESQFPVLSMAQNQAFKAKAAPTVMQTIVNIFPDNMWKSFTSASMLQVIFIAIIFGGGILLAGEKGKPTAVLVRSMEEVMMKVMMMIINVSPVGVFCLMAWVVASQGPSIVTSLALVIGVAYIGYIIHAFVVYSLSAKIFADMHPADFFRGIMPAFLFAFTSTSSLATLPISMECADKLGVKREVSSFVLPLGATVNMDGTAIYQCVATVFLARCMGMHLTGTQLVTVVLTATLASIGTAGTSGAGTIMLAMVLEAVGIDPIYIGIIFGADRIFDMGRTSLNVIGDISCSVCVNKWYNAGTVGINERSDG